MDAKELRIGNWVFCDEINNFYPGGFIQVEEILSDGIERSHGGLTVYELDQIHPIPLTPEILEKAGFTFYDNPNKTPSRIYKIGSDFRICKCYNQDHFTLWDYPYGKSIRYLHQLQNLYFALTGEELNIEL